MKHFLLALTLVSGTVFADTCFKADAVPSAESKLPEIVCVNNYKFETIIPGLPKNPFFQATVDSSLGIKTQEAKFYNFQKAPFTVTVNFPVVSDIWGSCSHSYRSEIAVEFLIDEKGNTLENSLKVVGTEEESNDPCHMSDRETVNSYSKI